MSIIQHGTFVIHEKPFVCSTLVSGGFVYRTILWAGEYYLLNHHQYAAIQRGETPESLGLEPSTNDTDD
jgi:hypothetical protein